MTEGRIPDMNDPDMNDPDPDRVGISPSAWRRAFTGPDLPAVHVQRSYLVMIDDGGGVPVPHELRDSMRFTVDSYRKDLERYERELRQARISHGEEHPLVQLWLRRKRTAERMIRFLEEHPR